MQCLDEFSGFDEKSKKSNMTNLKLNFDDGNTNYYNNRRIIEI
jgi:hypothetical protein